MSGGRARQGGAGQGGEAAQSGSKVRQKTTERALPPLRPAWLLDIVTNGRRGTTDKTLPDGHGHSEVAAAEWWAAQVWEAALHGQAGTDLFSS